MSAQTVNVLVGLRAQILRVRAELSREEVASRMSAPGAEFDERTVLRLERGLELWTPRITHLYADAVDASAIQLVRVWSSDDGELGYLRSVVARYNDVARRKEAWRIRTSLRRPLHQRPASQGLSQGL